MLRSSEPIGHWSQEKVLWPSLVVLFLFGPGAALAPGYFTKMLQNMASHTAKCQKNPSRLCLQAWGALAPNQAFQCTTDFFPGGGGKTYANTCSAQSRTASCGVMDKHIAILSDVDGITINYYYTYHQYM